MKYLLLMNTMRAGSRGLADWPKKDADAHLAYWGRLNRELSEAGEFVAVEALRDMATIRDKSGHIAAID